MTEQWTAEAPTMLREAPKPLTQIEIDQRVFDLYDEYCHGHIDRREFLTRAAAVTVGGLAMAQALLPRYAQAQTISFTDPRIKARYVNYPSPGGTSGTMRGYLMQPEGAGPFPTVLVIHENRRLNPYIEDTQHGFHNNSTPRYHEASAKLAWERKIAHFKHHLA